MPSKCSHCNKITETTSARRLVSKSVPITDQKRKDYLKSDYEVVHETKEGSYCNYCGFVGDEADFEEVEEVKGGDILKTNKPFDIKEHYKGWLKWIEDIRVLVKRETKEEESDA